MHRQHNPHIRCNNDNKNNNNDNEDDSNNNNNIIKLKTIHFTLFFNAWRGLNVEAMENNNGDKLLAVVIVVVFVADYDYDNGCSRTTTTLRQDKNQQLFDI